MIYGRRDGKMEHDPISVESLVSILAQGYFQQSMAYEDLLELTEKQLEHCQEKELGQEDVKIKLAGMKEERARLLGHIAKMNESLEKVKNQIAVTMGVPELSFDMFHKEASGQSTAELEKILSQIGQLLGRIKVAEEQMQKLNP
jgi:hypothetical protein